MAPKGPRRITANPHANGGMLRKPLDRPDYRDFAVKVEKPGQIDALVYRKAGATFWAM